MVYLGIQHCRRIVRFLLGGQNASHFVQFPLNAVEEFSRSRSRRGVGGCSVPEIEIEFDISRKNIIAMF